MMQTFKFGRGYVECIFELFDPRFFDIVNYPRFSYSAQGSYGTSGTSGRDDDDDINPQIKMKGIKKFYHKGKYPRPRNT